MNAWAPPPKLIAEIQPGAVRTFSVGTLQAIAIHCAIHPLFRVIAASGVVDVVAFIVMFSCNTCLRRALLKLAYDLPPDAVPSNVRSIVTATTRRATAKEEKRAHGSTRNHATLTGLKKGHHRRDLIKLNKGSNHRNSPLGKNRRTAAPRKLSKVEIKDALAREKNKAWLTEQQIAEENEEEEDDKEDEDEDDLVRPSEAREVTKAGVKALRKSDSISTESEVQEKKMVRRATKEVEKYFQDPLQLASGVLDRLRIPDIEGALRLVRASEAFKIKNSVSWNHCIDWCMGQGDIKRSLQIYNEMKKRGHMPDRYTYTILLRGLSQHVQKPGAVREAVKIYNSMFAPNSNVTPNTIHTNAILNVCARGGDMDALWAVTARLPETGPGSPDRLTYTLIFNAIRENTIRQVARTVDKVKFKGDEAAAEEERKRMFDKAVADGRKLWEDVSYKWRRANLVIDEELVCAMGRLLVGCGAPDDIKQVFDLVEGTMNIRIPERKTRQSSPLLLASGGSGKSVAEGNEGGVKASALPLKESNIYATPGPRTIALLMDAMSLCKGMRHLAPSYWDVLTSSRGFGVNPDGGSITSYLRILRTNRSSARALELLSQDWPAEIARVLYRRAPFIIAFSTCSRDKNNPNVFATAQKLLKLMQEKFEENELGMYEERAALSDMPFRERKEHLKKQKQANSKLSDDELAEIERTREGVESLPIDPKVLNYFIELAVDTTPGWIQGIRGKDTGKVFERDPEKNHTMIALRTIRPLLGQIKRLVKVKLDELQVPSKLRSTQASRVGEDLEELLPLMRTIIGTYDKIIAVADRFQRQRKDPIDAEVVANYNSWKREYTAYLARVEGILGKKVKRAPQSAIEDEPEESEDADIGEPDIERKIRSVLGEVDEKIMHDRAEKKGFKESFFPSSAMPVKIHSRKQGAEREQLVAKKMEQQFGRTDYGVLNEELGIENSNTAKTRSEQPTYSSDASQRYDTFVPQRQLRPALHPKQQKRTPMIGDELGLNDEDDPQEETREFRPARSMQQEDIPFEARITRTTNPSQRSRGSILDRPDVRHVWDRPGELRAAASG